MACAMCSTQKGIRVSCSNRQTPVPYNRNGIRMMKKIILTTFLASVAIIVGCDRGKKGGGQAQTQPAAESNTIPIPKIGLPYVTKENYKPLIGKYGGRIVRSTIGEPKSFNPITSGESSTTEYTMFIFQGL